MENLVPFKIKGTTILDNYIKELLLENKRALHGFFYKHIKIQGLGSDMLKATQNIG